MSKYKGIFFGTPEIGASALKAALDLGVVDIVAVVTQPDKPVGPKRKVDESPVKLVALQHQLPLLQPEDLDPSFMQEVKALEPDFILLAAYGKILPDELLGIPRIAPVNVHPSRLPELRGASPIQYAIIEGLENTAVSLMIMVAEVDAGPIIYQSSDIKVSPDETTASLTHKILPVVEEVIQTALEPFLKGDLVPKAQDTGHITHSRIIKKQDARLVWSKRAQELEREVRAYQPWPVSFFEWNGMRIQVTESRVLPNHSKYVGMVQRTEKGFSIQTAEGSLELTSIKPSGKKVMRASDFLNGYPQILQANLSSYILEE